MANPCRDCEMVIQFTRLSDMTKLDQLLLNAVQEIAGANTVCLYERGTEIVLTQPGDDILDISRGPDDSARLVLSGRTQSLASIRLKEILEVYANQYYLLSRGNIDLMTGLYNRRVFDERMQSIFWNDRNNRRHATPPKRALAIIDVDHFKNINDTYGHLYGDEILILLTGMMKSSFRTDDWLFRIGGEEFVVVLNNIELVDAQHALESFRQKVAERNFPRIGHVRVSVGVTMIDNESNTPRTLTEADRALYYSKNNGRNRISTYSELIASGQLIEVDELGGEFEVL